ncbi:MAG TPA: phosphatase PAP2 family protein, partial [Polyangiaceae bacterium]|nr:phosphatase PAP2 family protein [Polyangiaceae bacterium]
ELIGSAAVFTGGELAGERASHCGWCTTNGFDRTLRGLFVMRGASRTAATASKVLSWGAVPALAVVGIVAPAMEADSARFALQDSVILLSSLLLETGVTQGTKKLADRRRPGFHYGRAEETEAHDQPEEEFASFYSGDTAWAFTAVSASTTLAVQRGYWTAPYIATLGGGLALGTGILRISADMHWATDVLSGAAVGTAVGIGVPALLHPRRGGTTVAMLPSVSSKHVILVVSGTF